MRMGALKSTILPLVSTFAMVATTPAVVLAGVNRTEVPRNGSANGVMTLRCLSIPATGRVLISWQLTVLPGKVLVRDYWYTVRLNDGQVTRFIAAIPGGSTEIRGSHIFNAVDNGTFVATISGFGSGIGLGGFAFYDLFPVLAATCQPPN